MDIHVLEQSRGEAEYYPQIVLFLLEAVSEEDKQKNTGSYVRSFA
jgi:hypothetical protein